MTSWRFGEGESVDCCCARGAERETTAMDDGQRYEASERWDDHERRGDARGSAPPHTPPSERSVGAAWCTRCGYELTGLSLAGNCPECGLAVRESEEAGLLATADRETIEGYRAGSKLVSSGWTLYVLVTVLSLIYGFAIGVAGGMQSASGGGSSAPVLVSPSVDLAINISLALISTAMYGALAWGAWKLTERLRDASGGLAEALGTAQGAGEPVALTARWIGVFMAVTGGLGALASVLTPMWSVSGAVATYQMFVGPALLYTWAWVGMAVFAGVMMSHVRRLSRLAGERSGMQFAGTMVWLGPVLLTAGAMFCGLGPLVAACLFVAVHRKLGKRLAALGRQSTRERQLA